MSRITIAEVAEALGQSQQTVRVFLQCGVYPFGVAMKQPGSKHYTYTIFPAKFHEYVTTGGKPITAHLKKADE